MSEAVKVGTGLENFFVWLCEISFVIRIPIRGRKGDGELISFTSPHGVINVVVAECDKKSDNSQEHDDISTKNIPHGSHLNLELINDASFQIEEFFHWIFYTLHTAGSSGGDLANTIGSPNAEITMPIVRLQIN